MSVWATVADVTARGSQRDISANSRPSTSQVQVWLDYAEAQIRAVLGSRNLRVTYSSPDDDDAILILREKATDYADGRFLRAISNSEGDIDNLHGQPQIDSFNAFLDQIRAGEIGFGQELEQGDVSSDATGVRSNITHTPGKSPSDFPHRVTMAEVID